VSDLPTYFFHEEKISEVRENAQLTISDITNWLLLTGIIITSLFFI
jgi:hypothetical protein